MSRLAEQLARLLEPGERDAVLGDLEEAGVNGVRAVRDLLGVLARRQAELWRDWRPWLALLAVVSAGGVLLERIAAPLCHALWLQLRTHWVYGVRYETGLSAAEDIVVLLCHGAAAVLWSWSGGLFVGFLARKTAWVHATMVGLVWLALLALPALLPLLLLIAVFWIPGIYGLRTGLRSGKLPASDAVTLAFAVAALAALTTWTSGWRQEALVRWSEGVWQGGAGWQDRLLPFLVASWPAAFLMLASLRRRSMQKSLFLLTAAWLTGLGTNAVAQTSPHDYPQWRGRSRDGSASAFSPPRSWPESLTRRWTVEVGEGYATPIVVGNAVYAFTRRGGNEWMTALDAATGKILWRTGYPAPYEMFEATRAHGAGPKSTPLFHNGRLYTLGITGIVSAFDASGGKLAWQKPAPAVQPFYGAASSPLGEQDLVILHPGSYGPLTAFDANTGEQRWTAGGDGAYASPIVAELEGIRQVISLTQEHLIGVSVKGGNLLWRHPWKTQGNGTITPILYGDTILVTSKDLGVAAIKPVLRRDEWTVQVLWAKTEVAMFLSNPVVVGQTMFGLSHRSAGQYFALDAGSGKILWLGPPRQAGNAAIVKAGSTLFFLNDNAELIVVKASRAGFEPVRRYTLAASATWAQPAISGSRFFIKDVSTLTLWTLPENVR